MATKHKARPTLEIPMEGRGHLTPEARAMVDKMSSRLSPSTQGLDPTEARMLPRFRGRPRFNGNGVQVSGPAQAGTHFPKIKNSRRTFKEARAAAAEEGLILSRRGTIRDAETGKIVEAA